MAYEKGSPALAGRAFAWSMMARGGREMTPPAANPHNQINTSNPLLLRDYGIEQQIDIFRSIL